jgi:hypothetical protein
MRMIVAVVQTTPQFGFWSLCSLFLSGCGFLSFNLADWLL